MSGEPLRTHTERVRDQRRIEALEAELAALARAYSDAMEALAKANEWRGEAILAALVGGTFAILLLREVTQ